MAEEKGARVFYLRFNKTNNPHKTRQTNKTNVFFRETLPALFFVALTAFYFLAGFMLIINITIKLDREASKNYVTFNESKILDSKCVFREEDWGDRVVTYYSCELLLESPFVGGSDAAGSLTTHSFSHTVNSKFDLESESFFKRDIYFKKTEPNKPYFSKWELQKEDTSRIFGYLSLLICLLSVAIVFAGVCHVKCFYKLCKREKKISHSE